MTSFKIADGEDSIFLLFIFILLRLRQKRRKLAQLRKEESFGFDNYLPIEELQVNTYTGMDMKATGRELYFRYARFHLFCFFLRILLLRNSLIVLNVSKTCILQFGNIIFYSNS